MFSILLRIFLLVFILWLLRRFLAAFMGGSQKARSNNNSSTSPANYMVKDPVCGMYMDSRLAVRLERRKEEFYFCSEECKSKYLSDSTREGVGPAAAG
jgi:uncharacterized protein